MNGKKNVSKRSVCCVHIRSVHAHVYTCNDEHCKLVFYRCALKTLVILCNFHYSQGVFSSRKKSLPINPPSLLSSFPSNWFQWFFRFCCVYAWFRYCHVWHEAAVQFAFLRCCRVCDGERSRTYAPTLIRIDNNKWLVSECYEEYNTGEKAHGKRNP